MQCPVVVVPVEGVLLEVRFAHGLVSAEHGLTCWSDDLFEDVLAAVGPRHDLLAYQRTLYGLGLNYTPSGLHP